MMTKGEQNEALKLRTKQMALRVLKVFRELKNTDEGKIVGRQLFRSATSVAANYRAACRARSQAEFISKMSIVVEETDETLFWLEFAEDAELLPVKRLGSLKQETEEILMIMSKARTTTMRNKKASN